MIEKIGFLINPVAGMGGSVGLKGSDGAEILKSAVALGATPMAGERARVALRALAGHRDFVELLTGPGAMGADVAAQEGFKATVLPVGSGKLGFTTPQDTITLAARMKEQGAGLILFAGGDGTARNIFSAVGGDMTVIGIPAGVKIHSAVYANNPKSAGCLAARMLTGKVVPLGLGEVMDLDEAQFRRGVVAAKLFGYLRVPLDRSLLQCGKQASGAGNRDAALGIAQRVSDEMDAGCLYIIGPGTTTQAIMDTLGLAGTLLGIDAVQNRALVGADLNESRLLELLAAYPRARIIVTPIGGQACLFGRGNQQISPAVIKRVGRENITVVATKQKIDSFYGQRILVDTGDEAVDAMLRGFVRVVVSYSEEVLIRID